MAFKNTNDMVPLGWFVFIPETGWTSPKYIGLDQAAQELQKHRQANPRFNWATDLESCRKYVLDYSEARLRAMPGGEQWLMPGPSESPPVPMFRLRHRQPEVGLGAAEGASTAGKIVAGIGAVLSWLGGGLKPVDQQTANERAVICETCPQNQKLEGIERAIGTIGDVLHSIAQAKAQMKLATPFDSALHQCTACGCVNATKVWVPADHVRRGITPEIEAQLAENCWIKPLLRGQTQTVPS